jgi:hypothetical protein
MPNAKINMRLCLYQNMNNTFQRVSPLSSKCDITSPVAVLLIVESSPCKVLASDLSQVP